VGHEGYPAICVTLAAPWTIGPRKADSSDVATVKPKIGETKKWRNEKSAQVAPRG
jgi:hypothetical protein